MFKNKKLVGLLICICLLFCSIFAITLTSSSNLDSSKNIKETKVQQESKKIFVLKQNEKENLQSQSNQETKSNQSNINQSSKVETNQGNNNISSDYIENTKCYITLSIDCKTILNNLSELPEQYHAFVPNNGAILIEKKVSINEGDTVFDVLVKVTKMQKIQVSSIGGYIQSINNLPEKLFNGSGGWMYEVNGVYGDKGSLSLIHI